MNVLRAISRCKDELISPAAYLAESEKALVAAKTEEQRAAAEKCIEVAEIYRVYEDELIAADAVDFGDLILHAVKLVEEQPDVQAFTRGFTHVLVDEIPGRKPGKFSALARCLRRRRDGLGRRRRTSVRSTASGALNPPTSPVSPTNSKANGVRSLKTIVRSAPLSVRSNAFQRAWDAWGP